MNRIKIFFTGVILGALSWAVCPIVSKHFEPFDTTVGLIIGQIILCAAVINVSFCYNFIGLLVLILGMHFGQNGYSYAFGDTEHRAWIGLGFVINLIFLAVPFLFGVLSLYIKRTMRKGD